MSVSLVVPISDDGAERTRNWLWLRRQYPPAWELVECPFTGEGEWSKGVAVNAGAAWARGIVLVIADADVYVARLVLDEAVSRVISGAPWVMPHGTVYRLTEARTRALCASADSPIPRPVVGRHHRGPVGGGIVVCTRAAFDTVGGIDPRFTGWGGEDISFGRALDTLVGPHVRLNAAMWHLWHTPLPRHEGRRASPENEALANRYLDAAGDVAAMTELVSAR